MDKQHRDAFLEWVGNEITDARVQIDDMEQQDFALCENLQHEYEQVVKTLRFKLQSLQNAADRLQEAPDGVGENLKDEVLEAHRSLWQTLNEMLTTAD